MRLYDSSISGNGYKARLLLALQNRPYERIAIDILRGESRTPEFLAVNPNGRIPVLVLDDGRILAESNAILFFLAEKTPFLPDDPFARAMVLQWMFFEQYSHEPYIAVVRFWRAHLDMTPEREAALDEKMTQGYAALDTMETQLGAHDWFGNDAFSIADIALYAYTHVANEGGYDLSSYGAIRAWFERIESAPGYIPISQT
ncbi:MAG: glutathione S-transferase [Alphaproteobacteria bacterium]